MTNNESSLTIDLMMALTQADKDLMQANNRIALLEQTLRNTERELLRVKTELELAISATCDTIGEQQ